MRLELYPKLVIEVDSTRSEDELRQALDAHFEVAKTGIRAIFATDLATDIVSWHMHKSAGSVDEPEPRII